MVGPNDRVHTIELDVAKVFGLDRIREIQLAFRRRLRHTVVFMDREANVLIDEAGVVPDRVGQRPHPCEHCAYILDDTALGAQLCHASDSEAARIAGRLGRALLYKCWTHKSNVAIPITVGGLDVIGNLYAGQFFAVVDTEEDKVKAEQLCDEKGFVIHNGKTAEGEPTISIQAGFFWTREEIEAWGTKQQELFYKEAHIRVPVPQLQMSWRAVPRIGYEDAIASVELLTAVANTLATEGYEKLAYMLHNNIIRAFNRYASGWKELGREGTRLVTAADQTIAQMVSAKQGAAAAAGELARLYLELLSFLMKWRCSKLDQDLGLKRTLLELTDPSSPVDNLVKELYSLREEIDGLRTP